MRRWIRLPVAFSIVALQTIATIRRKVIRGTGYILAIGMP